MSGLPQIEIPLEAGIILETLKSNGFKAFLVGGCVRDCLIGRQPLDWDISTDAKPVEVKILFDKTVDTGITHGTVTVVINSRSFEVTTFRIDGEYSDNRRPVSVGFTSSVHETCPEGISPSMRWHTALGKALSILSEESGTLHAYQSVL